MLGLLRTRCERTAPNLGPCLETHHTDALTYLATATPKTYDLVVTHFFLDCFTQAEVEFLVHAITLRVAPGALWLISDFRIPPGAMRYPARLIVRGLYFAFRVLTGLRIQRLPDHVSPLASLWTRRGERHFLCGLLTTELWTFHADLPERKSA